MDTELSVDGHESSVLMEIKSGSLPEPGLFCCVKEQVAGGTFRVVMQQLVWPAGLCQKSEARFIGNFLSGYMYLSRGYNPFPTVATISREFLLVHF